ncbi:MAG: hypothetical protein PUG48_06870 [Clostridia bacterium]|nr:hypothetical protein [Clostridia bacterium]
MNRIISIFLCFLICISLILCGCKKNEENLTCNAKVNILSGNPDVDFADESIKVDCSKKDSVELLFEKNGLIACEFYEVSAVINISENQYVAIGSGDNDINAKSIIKQVEKNESEISRIVKTNSEGKCSFKIFIGNDKENLDGNVSIETVIVKPIDQSTKYCLYTSTDNKVRIIFNKDDVKNSGIDDNQIVKWLDILSEFRKEADKISVYGIPNIDFCATEEFSHYALSGNPVYICRTYVENDLQKISETIDSKKEKRDILWRYIHEICHIADGVGYGEIANRVFDKEFSAQLECAYLMEKLGYKYDGEKNVLEYFSKSIPLENKIFSDEGFLYSLISIIEKTDPELKSIEKAITSSKYNSDMTNMQKLNIFLGEISDYLGFDIKKSFSENELNVIMKKYK